MDQASEALLPRIEGVRRALADSGPVWERGAGDFQHISLPYDDGNALRDLLRAEEASVVIEIGLAYGASALAIIAALADHGRGDGARHLIIDAFQETFEDAGWDILVGLGVDHTCELQRAKSHVALPMLVKDGVVADAAFVDGSHAFHNVFVDLFFLRELVRPGGVIILDDYEWPSVATAARYFEVNAGWEPVKMNRATRLRAFRVPHDWIDPGFERFESFGLDLPP